CRRKSGGSRPALRGCRCCCRRHGRARAARCARPLIRPPGTFSRKREKGWNRTGSADPVRSTGRAGGGCFLCARFLCTSKEKVARAVTARKPLILMSAKERRVQTRPTGLPLLLPATRKSKSCSLRPPPHPPSGHLLPQAGEGLEPHRLRGPGAQHRARRRGVLSLRQVSLHKQREGGSRRHGAKALDLDVGERAAGQDPPYGAAVAVAGDTEEQEQLAALAPSSALRAPSPASGRRAGTA